MSLTLEQESQSLNKSKNLQNINLGVERLLEGGLDLLDGARVGHDVLASTYRFTGTGFGHGVGLCQTGAAARATRGEAVADILSAYYPGAALSRVLPSGTRSAANLVGWEVPGLLRSP